MIDPDALMSFFLKCGVMLANAIPMGQALRSLERETVDPELRAVITDLCRRIGSGESLVEAFSSWPHVFTSGVLALVKGAQDAGAADLVFRNIAEYLAYARLAEWKSDVIDLVDDAVERDLD